MRVKFGTLIRPWVFQDHKLPIAEDLSTVILQKGGSIGGPSASSHEGYTWTGKTENNTSGHTTL